MHVGENCEWVCTLLVLTRWWCARHWHGGDIYMQLTHLAAPLRHPPPLARHYRSLPLPQCLAGPLYQLAAVKRRPVVVICNKFKTEWLGAPVNFISPRTVVRLLRTLVNAGFTVVYIRDGPERQERAGAGVGSAGGGDALGVYDHADGIRMGEQVKMWGVDCREPTARRMGAFSEANQVPASALASDGSAAA